jgi:hypothetical protein
LTSFCQAIAYILSSCADQTELINSNLPNGVSYSIDCLLEGGEEVFSLPKNSRHFGLGDKKALEEVMIPNTPLSAAIEKMVWNGRGGELGSLVCFYYNTLSYCLLLL